MPRGNAGKVPTAARHNARSLANLKKGGSPGRYPKGTKLTPEQKAEEKEARKIARKLLLDPEYQKNLAERLNNGKCQPGVEVAVWQYAFGKPVETIETKQIVPVRIQHEYSE